MSTRNKNFLVAYICLVGLPIIGLLAVLDFGRGIRAPLAVGGVWEIHSDRQSVAQESCNSLPHLLKIVQSGEYLTLSVDDMQGEGWMKNAALSARELRPTNGNKIRSGFVYAHLEGPVERGSLIGNLGVNGSGCAPAPFIATRLARPRGNTE